MSHAYEGFCHAKGIKKKFDPTLYPSEEGRKALRAREEREKRG